jgi:hypothetical protein
MDGMSGDDEGEHAVAQWCFCDTGVQGEILPGVEHRQSRYLGSQALLPENVR